MIGSDVEQHGDLGRQCPRALQLEARQFQDIQLRRVFGEEVQRRLAQVAAGQNLAARRMAHMVDERRDRALAIRSGDGDERRLGLAREKLDVRYDLEFLAARLLQQLVVVGHTRRDDDAVDVPGQFCLAESYVGVRPQVAQRVDSGRRIARVDERRIDAVAFQIARDGQPGRTQPDDEIFPCHGLFFHGAHRIFRLASPISTRMTVMIQNRTMTLGSAQPFSSKW